MGFAAPRSLVCEQVENLLGRSHSALIRPFPADLAVSLLTVPRPLWGRGSSSLELFIPFSVHVRSPALRTLPSSDLSTITRRASERLPWGFALFATSTGSSTDADFPSQHQGSFPGHPESNLPFRAFPSSTFRTSSTSCSTAGLASLFHPAAAFRVYPSGVCPSTWVRSGFPRSLSPPAVEHPTLRFPAPTRMPSASGVFSPTRVRWLA